VPGVPGHIGLAMHAATFQGTAPYVAWVDDDDLVLPNAFSAVRAGLRTDPAAVFARELRVMANGHVFPYAHRHHLSVYRRDIVQSAPLAEVRSIPNLVLQQRAEQLGPCVDLDEWVYIRRMRVSAASGLRSAFKEQESRQWLI
jgi:hypothetical protein